MKIKAVCEAVGLTDRAVRYYIEEGLVSPAYTENYLGRRTFDFSEDDVRTLSRIAILRKYDFSIPEIRTMAIQPEMIASICMELIERKRKSIAADSESLASLEKTIGAHPRSIEELASALAAPSAPLPAEDAAHRLPLRIGSVLYIVACVLPILLAAFMLLMAKNDYRYIVFNAVSLIVMLAALIPSVLGLVLPKHIKDQKHRIVAKSAVSCICLVCLAAVFFSGLFLSYRSETNDLENYLRMDDSSRAFDDNFFFELFPSRFDFLYSGKEPVSYHYCDYEDLFGHKTDMFAERKLDSKDFDSEIADQRRSFNSYYELNSEHWRVYGGEHGWQGEIALKLEEFSHGRYDCIALYTEAAPFEEYHESRTIYMFAYDPDTLTVRYAFYASNDYSKDPPFFCEASWGSP